MDDAVLVFDLDGTLFQTALVTVPAVQDSFRDAGLVVPDVAVILDFIGKPMSELTTWVHTVCGDRDGQQIMRRIDQRELELAESVGQLFPGVTEVLEGLKGEYRALALCTNGGPEYVNRIIDSQGIRPFFDMVRCRNDETDSKPMMVAEILRNLDSAAGVVTGDRREDVEAAHRNSLLAVGAGYGYGSDDELRCADAIAADPGAIPELIAQVLNDR